MGDTSKKEKSESLHPVYTVTNIQNKVHILDWTKVTYSSWVKLFHLHAQGYMVLHHIDGTKPPAKTDPTYESWNKIDAIVLQWIYGTLSDELLVRVLETESTAYEAWTRLKNIFTNNKGARTTTLEHEFIKLSLKSMPSFEAYCQKLKELADQLADVDSLVSEKHLVLQMVRGLPNEYETTAALINQALTCWEEAINMIQSDQQRQAAREVLNSPVSEMAATISHDQQPSRR
ncbi:hypothetical protein E3N88_22791 [Mikania micrantha]|uniref:Retrotransposon Copia-like N-terminal domain-containing protein n=1 Tax=Mikania micrantha TaxID=192012 RepID=A0A5N6ND61_9ASTR|nr:hypothetical protein E3N88_22791 [Mikania micrantha]